MSQSDYNPNQKPVKDPKVSFPNNYDFSDQIVINTNQNNEQLARHQVFSIQKQFEQKQILESQTQRVNQPAGFFIIHVLIAAIISFQNIFIIYGVGQFYDQGVKIIITDLFFIVVFSFINSYYLVPFKTVVLMYTLLDGVLVAQIAALIGLVGSLLLTSSQDLTSYLLMTMIPISFFFFVGNFRICIRFADWNRYQIIIYKLAILSGAVCFFEIGAYFMAVDYSYTNGQLQDVDSKIKDFITLYAFGTFEFFRELFAKICDFDQTADLKWTYEFKKQGNQSQNNQDTSNQIEMKQMRND